MVSLVKACAHELTDISQFGDRFQTWLCGLCGETIITIDPVGPVETI